MAAIRETQPTTRTSAPAGLSKNGLVKCTAEAVCGREAPARAGVFAEFNVVVISCLSVVCYSLRRIFEVQSKKLVVKTSILSIWFKNE